LYEGKDPFSDAPQAPHSDEKAEEGVEVDW